MTAPKKKRGGRRNPPGGAPVKGNVRLVCYVRADTRAAIDEAAEKGRMTLGEVVDGMQRKIEALSSELMWLKFGGHDRDDA